MSVQRDLLISQQNQTIYNALKRSMVLWYDVKRQGATNKSMSTNPKLLDLSGNGYDLDCKGFSWSEMSGIGGYITPPFTSKEWFKTPNNTGEYTCNEYTLHVTKGTEAPTALYYVNLNKTISDNPYIESYTADSVTIKPIKFKVSGLPENSQVIIDGIYAETNTSDNYKVPNIKVGNGEHVYNPGTIETDITIKSSYNFQFPRIFVDVPENTACDVTVEFLPEYPDALVFDGVKDYATVFPFSIIPHKTYFRYNNGEYTTGFFSSDGWKSLTQKVITEIPSPFKMRISGISGIEPTSPCVVFLWDDSERVMKTISPTFVEDGVYTVADIDPLPELTPGLSYAAFINLNSYIGHDIKIDILPDETKALPLFTPEPGFSVIAKRTIIPGSTTSAPVAAKSAGNNTNGSFKLEYQYHHNEYDNFGGINNVTHPELVTYQTAHKINGSPAVSSNLPGCNFLCIAKFRPWDDRVLNMALYSFILFNRDLTEEEINWVKNNLIEGNFTP